MAAKSPETKTIFNFTNGVRATAEELSIALPLIEELARQGIAEKLAGGTGSSWYYLVEFLGAPVLIEAFGGQDPLWITLNGDPTPATVERLTEQDRIINLPELP